MATRGVDLIPVYLQPGLDASKLKVAELRSALSREEIDFNPAAKKPELLQIFKTNIEANAPKLRKQYQNIRPSSRGIYEISASETESVDLDGMDGDPEPPAKGKKKKRKPPIYAPPPPPEIPMETDGFFDHLNGAGNSTIQVEAAITTAKKKRKSRVSEAFNLDEDDEGNSSFSDYNPFQTRASAPNSPNLDGSTRKRSRNSSPSRKGRESGGSTSMIPSSFYPKASTSQISTPIKERAPSLEIEEAIYPATPSKNEKAKSNTPTPLKSALRKRTSNGIQKGLQVGFTEPHTENEKHRGLFLTLVFGAFGIIWFALKTLALVSLLVWLAIWNIEKQAIGFCDPSSMTNSLLVRRYQTARPFISPRLSFVPPISEEYQPLIQPFLPEPTCFVCPLHADCSNGIIKGCNATASDYVLQEHPLQLRGTLPPIPALSIVPSCAPDTERLQRIVDGTLAVKARLRKRRGEVMCSSLSWGTKEPRDFAVNVDEILSEVEEDVRNTVRAELEVDREVITIDDGLKKAFASAREDLPWTCWVRQRTLAWIWENKFSLLGLIFLVYQLNNLRRWIKRRNSDPPFVQSLYKQSIHQVRENSYNNRKDPGHYPYPYIVPINMRDSLLDDYSISERQRIWKQVERKVEGNSNVRVVFRAHRGEEVKIWEWVGFDSPQLG